MENESSQEPLKQDQVLELNFVPTWARQPAGQNPYAHFEGGERRGPRDRDDRERRRDDRGVRRDKPRGPGGRGAPGGREKRGGKRFDRRGGDRGDRRDVARPERLPPPPVDVAFIPERSRLGALVHDLKVSGRAYPLVDLAVRFLATAVAYEVKMETRPGPNGKRPSLFQCRECKRVFLDRGAVITHATASHLDTLFVREELQTEPPAGHFVCVARCRLSGELLGPPNYHGYNERLQELWRKRFAHLSLDEYRSNIETIRDPDLIEKWKQESTKQVVYRRKDQEGAPPLKRSEAEKQFLDQVAGFVVEGSRFIVPAEVAQRFEDGRLKAVVRETWERESRRPYSLMFALRPALNHMRLHMFRVGSGMTFVTPIQPHPLQPEQAIQTIAEVIAFLRKRPGCTRQQLVSELRPGAAPESSEVAAVISPLRWLVEKGHVIEFFDGTLSVPAVGRSPKGSVPAASEPH